MKKIFTLLAAALMAVTASAADNLWEVTSDAAIAAGTTLIDNEVLTVKNVFATKGVTLGMFIPSVTIDDHTFTYSFGLMSAKTPDADNPNGTEYTTSADKTTLVADVKKKTTVTAYYAKGYSGDFKVYNQNDFANLFTPSAAFEKAGDFAGSTTWGTVKYDFEPGTYVFFSTFSPINLLGLSWTGESGSAADETYLCAFGVEGQPNHGCTIDGTTDDTRTVTLEDGTKLNALSFNNNWGATNENYIKLSTDGGFKAGDVVSLSGVIANNDASKRGACCIFTLTGTGEDRVQNKLYTTEDFPNLNINPTNDLPVYKYTLEADAETLYLGRDGNTRTQMVMISVVRSGNGDDNKSGIESVIAEDENAPVEYYNLQGVRIAEPAAGQIVIRRQGSKVQKILVR